MAKYPVVILVKDITNMVFACKHAAEMLQDIQEECGIFTKESVDSDSVFYRSKGGPTPKQVLYHKDVLNKDVYATVYEDRFGTHIVFGPAKKVWSNELNIFELDVELEENAARDPWAVAHRKEW